MRNPYKSTNVLTLIMLSILAAFASILKAYSPGTETFRISLFAIPLIIAGILGGPFLGGVAGFLADTTYSIFFSKFPYNPFFAISMILWGVVGGLLIRNKKGQIDPIWLVIMILITSLLETTINTIGLWIFISSKSAFFDLGFRIVLQIIKWPIVVSVVKILDDRLVSKFLIDIENRKFNSYKKI